MLHFKAIGRCCLPEYIARFVRLERFRAALVQAGARSAVWKQQIPLTSSLERALHEFGRKFSAAPNTESAPVVGCGSCPYVFASLKSIRLRLPFSLSVSLRSTESSINLHCGIKFDDKCANCVVSHFAPDTLHLNFVGRNRLPCSRQIFATNSRSDVSHFRLRFGGLVFRGKRL